MNPEIVFFELEPKSKVNLIISSVNLTSEFRIWLDPDPDPTLLKTVEDLEKQIAKNPDF